MNIPLPAFTLNSLNFNNYYFFILQESMDPHTRTLYRKKIKPKGNDVYLRPSIGMEKMRTGLFAYQVELQAGYRIISDTFNEPEKCGLKHIEPFQLPMLAIPVRKNFPYKELFRRQLVFSIFPPLLPLNYFYNIGTEFDVKGKLGF